MSLPNRVPVASASRPMLRLVEGGIDERRSKLLAAIEHIRPVFQPIVWAHRPVVYAHEVFVRCDDPTLDTPVKLFTAAEQVGETAVLEREIRRMVAGVLDELDERTPVFVNVHPAALDDGDLFDPDAPLSAHADRVVVEITERAPLDEVEHLGDKLACLRGMGYRIAVDDLGAGYQGLKSFAETNPDIVKFDMSLIRGIESEPVHAELVQAMIDVCHDLRILTVGVGVETEAERLRLIELGCQLLQGYRFARPQWPLPAIEW